MTDVWVVRNRHGDIVYFAVFRPTEKMDGWTVTRETLLTPESAAVIEKAKRQAEAGRRWETCTCGGRCAHEINYEMACSDTDFAVSTLRVLEGDA
jgi:hypothetical protein